MHHISCREIKEKRIMKKNKLIQMIKKLMQEVLLRIKLKEMDEFWYLTGGSCFGIFPSSFYYTHTPEEIEQITAEEIKKLSEMINQLEKS